MYKSIEYKDSELVAVNSDLDAGANINIDLQKEADLIVSALLDGHWIVKNRTGSLRVGIPKGVMRRAFLNVLFADGKHDALIDTIDLMVSDNYKDRLRAEYMQAKIRYDRMDDALISGKKIDDDNFFGVHFNVMNAYLSTLRSRADDLGIDLSQDEIDCDVARVVEEAMKLQEMEDLMNSDDYKDRFKAEYHQLKMRVDKLEFMIDRYEKGTLGFTPSCDIRILINQLFCMKLYMDILQDRADIEGIEL